MTAEKIVLTHPYRYLFCGAWLLFGVLLLLGFAQGQSFFTLILGLICFALSGYSFFAAVELAVVLDEAACLVVRKRPFNLRPRTVLLSEIERFTTDANRLRLEEDGERIGYHHTRPVAYEIEAVLKNGRVRLLAEAHTEAAAQEAVAFLQARL